MRGDQITALPKPKLTLEEYFALDNTAEGRYEYFAGEVFELSGTSPEPALLGSAVGRLFVGSPPESAQTAALSLRRCPGSVRHANL
jgi:hypothetical protein